MSSKDKKSEFPRFRTISQYDGYGIWKADENRAEVCVAGFKVIAEPNCCAIKVANGFQCPPHKGDVITKEAYEKTISALEASHGIQGVASALMAHFVQYKGTKEEDIAGKQWYDAMVARGWKKIAKFNNTVHDGNTIHSLMFITKGNERE